MASTAGSETLNSLEDLIGLQLAVGLPGTEATEDVIDRVRRTRARSLVVFSRNFSSPEQFTALLHGLDASLGWRLLVLVDHEGGRVVRFDRGVTRFPDALSIGATQGPDAVECQGAVEAEELARLGVHVNLAPCVDVLAAASDPVIGNRSYGSDPQRVAALAAARIRGLQAHGVAACAKHFPGLGAVPRDPHTTLPTIALGWEAMQRAHLAPFVAAVGAGVATVMSSHVCYPALDDFPGLPATFSSALIRGLLRRTMGFAGVILTDDLEMGALRAYGSMGDIAVRAIEAGHDLLLICSDLSAAQGAAEALGRAYQSGRLDRAALDASAARILRLRRKFFPGCP